VTLEDPSATGAVIVTGSGQAIGRAYALRFARDGRPLVIADLNAANAKAVAAEITAAGGRAIAVETDITDEASCTRMVAAARDAFGSIGALINNAAYFSQITPKPFWELTVAEWDAAMSVNLKGTWLATKAVVPAMMVQRSGSIVNIASSANFMGRPSYLHYVTSKAGIVGLTRSMAKELGEFNVRVNCLAPGGTVTEIKRKTMTDDVVEMLVGMQSIHRPGTPEDLVGYVAFLCSPEASFITGQTLIIDGGLRFH
jgi:3-oxoacyl-[acyl-carrier protein] reductase